MTIEIKVAILGHVMTFLGLCGTAYGVMRNNKLLRKENIRNGAEFMFNLRNLLISNPDLNEIFYQIEYNKLPSVLVGSRSPEERSLDKLLFLYDSIAQNYESENITRQDLSFVSYEFIRVFRNKNVQTYIACVKVWASSQQIKDVPFSAFMKVGMMLEEQNKKNSQ